MHLIHPRSLFAAAVATLAAAACATSVEGDGDPTYGDVVLTVVQRAPDGAELSRDERRGPGDDVVAPLDRELYQPIEIDGEQVTDPSGLLAAREARIGGVLLRREGDGLRVDGSTLLALQSARREGDVLVVEVDGGRFDVALAGALSDDSLDRFLATALVRLVRGEALLADDCRPDCIYTMGAPGWLCGPMRDAVSDVFGGDCIGPVTPEEWAALQQQIRTEGKRDTCYDLWLIPRPLCEWAYDMTVDWTFAHLGPDDSGLVCASDFYHSCTGAGG